METTHQAALADYFVQAAGIASPWRATGYRINHAAKALHIWITHDPLPQVEKKRRSWFGGSTVKPAVSSPSTTGPDLHWRHLNFLDYTCEIHTTDQLDERHHDLPWFGQGGLPFTNRMARHLFMCMMEGVEMNALCAILNIPFTDLWKFKFALDSGQIRFDYTATKKSSQPGAAALNGAKASATASADAAQVKASGTVPSATDPVWEHLITGDLNLQSTTLSFQLLLTKLRQQVSMQQSDEVKILKLRELHRYVERNERSLGNELKQLRRQSQMGSA
jgi:hypothetical protein